MAQGAAYGNWRLTYVSGTLKSVANGYVKDYKVGGATVYFELRTQTNSGTCVTPPYTSCSQSWYTHAYDDSAYSNSDLWVSTSASTGVRDTSDGARGTLRTCEEVRYAPDTCSGYWYSTPDTYS